MALATITARGLSRRTMLAAPLLVGRGARGFRIGGGLASLGLPRVGRAPVVPMSDVEQSAAQLDRRVRFKAGKPAGATLVTIIKAHLANRT